MSLPSERFTVPTDVSFAPDAEMTGEQRVHAAVEFLAAQSAAAARGRAVRENQAPQAEADAAPEPRISTVPRAQQMLHRMSAGEPFRTNDPGVNLRHLAAHDLTSAYNQTNARQKQLRRRILEDLFEYVGDEVDLRAPIYVEHGTQVSIGNGTTADHSLTLTDHAPITIGNNVSFGAGVVLLTLATPVESVPRLASWATAKPITIGDGATIGARAIVMPGVTIGERAVIGAGAVVTRDVPADVVAVGNPARILRQITDQGELPE